MRHLSHMCTNFVIHRANDNNLELSHETTKKKEIAKNLSNISQGLSTMQCMKIQILGVLPQIDFSS